jgi:hypothetical protein
MPRRGSQATSMLRGHELRFGGLRNAPKSKQMRDKRQ